jgi:hypothetical protein
MQQPRRETPLGRRGVAIAVAVLVLLVAVGCRPPADRAADGAAGGAAAATDEHQRQVDARVHEGPPRTGPATIEVEVRLDGTPVDGATVRVTGDMTHAGMVPVVDHAVRVEPGLYRTESFAFTMAGDWILTVDVTYPDGVSRQVEVAVSVGS